MIEFKTGNIFDQLNISMAIVNTVNCVGVMGKGVALEYKKRYPKNYSEYKLKCQSGEIQIGKSYVHYISDSKTTKFIINFPTKKHWRNPSKIEYIEQGLDNLIQIIKDKNITSLAMPALGCGNGNLDWAIVKPLIIKKLSSLTHVKIVVFEPFTTLNSTPKKKPSLTIDRKKLLLLMNEYNNSTSGPPLTYIQTHLLSYFLNFDNKKLKFSLNPSGPFLKEVNNVLKILEPYYISVVEINKNSAKQININTIKFPNQKNISKDDHYIKIRKLIHDFESYEGLLVLSICHWFKFIEKKEDINQSVLLWLNENHYSINKNTIDKALNRINAVYDFTENISFNFDV